MDENPTEEGQQWIQAHAAVGNWLDIAADEDIHPGIQGWARSIVQMFQLQFAPEIRKRKDAGQLPDDWFLYSAQLFQPLEGNNLVRLNDQIKGIAYTRADRPVAKGEQVMLDDLSAIVSYDLSNEELDAGHFTIWWSETGWRLFFDFRSGRAKSESFLDRALEYIVSARAAHRQGHVAPCIDTLHSACELTAKARLLLSNRESRKWKTHGKVKTALNQMRKLNNIEPAFATLFNQLTDIRATAKYSPDIIIDMPEWDDIDMVETIALGVRESVLQRGAPKVPDIHDDTDKNDR